MSRSSPRSPDDISSRHFVVLITGAGSGIGKALVESFASMQARSQRRRFVVYATSRRLATLRYCLQLPDDLDVRLAELDVSRYDQIDDVVRVVLSECGRLDILFVYSLSFSFLVFFSSINNAGMLQVGPLLEISPDRLEYSMRVNALAPLRIAQAFAPSMIERRAGLIVNVSSTASVSPLPYMGAYCSTKAALTSLSDCLRLELQPFGVRVVTVEPGDITTPIFRHSLDALDDEMSEYQLYHPQTFPSVRKSVLAISSDYDPNGGLTPANEFADSMLEMIVGGLDKGGIWPSLWRGGKNSTVIPFAVWACPSGVTDMVRKSVAKIEPLHEEVESLNKREGRPESHLIPEWRSKFSSPSYSSLVFVVLVVVAAVVLFAVMRALLGVWSANVMIELSNVVPQGTTCSNLTTGGSNYIAGVSWKLWITTVLPFVALLLDVVWIGAVAVLGRKLFAEEAQRKSGARDKSPLLWSGSQWICGPFILSFAVFAVVVAMMGLMLSELVRCNDSSSGYFPIGSCCELGEDVSEFSQLGLIVGIVVLAASVAFFVAFCVKFSRAAKEVPVGWMDRCLGLGAGKGKASGVIDNDDFDSFGANGELDLAVEDAVDRALVVGGIRV